MSHSSTDESIRRRQRKEKIIGLTIYIVVMSVMFLLFVSLLFAIDKGRATAAREEKAKTAFVIPAPFQLEGAAAFNTDAAGYCGVMKFIDKETGLRYVAITTSRGVAMTQIIEPHKH